ncbi:MAG: SH3 domain-containing protein [Acidobacteria bacterium]|nr:SH3 domain-containing protein [Acidobacteriota bacterium]
MKISLFLILVCLCSSIAIGQERYVKPVDEAAKDASFLAFRTKLIAAAERHDARYILGIIDPQIKLGFGGDDGLANFKKIWKINAKDSKFWEEFLAVIKNGGAFDGQGKNKYSSFTAPYLFSSWPEDIDGFEYIAVFGSDVNLRERPSADAKIVSTLSYNVVKPNNDESTTIKTGPGEDDWEFDWRKVETLGGKSGFVKAKYARSSIDYRAGFEKIRGVWKLTFLVAGD